MAKANSKRWSYIAITKHTESQIRYYIEAAKDEEIFDHRICQAKARGIFQYWMTLTTGWQKEGDAKRLEYLLNQRF